MKSKTKDRFGISFILSLIIHALLFGIIFLWPFDIKTPEPQKVKLENLLVLKRGQSEDRSKNTQGARKPALAAKQSQGNAMQNTASLAPPMRPSMPVSKPTLNPSKPEPETQKKQKDSEKKALDTYRENLTDPRNLSFLSQNSLSSFTASGGRHSIQNDKGNDAQTIKEIDELYGEEFGDLGEAEKEYIRDNLRHIGRITQGYLEYPRVAAYFGQSGVNAVEFYLHPNGDISDLKIIKTSGLNSFDYNTLKTIEIAYKDYPRPKVKTLIRINVTYSYYGN
ncbi:energy transducer TonB [Helicobacter sp. faydin-H20]|uniref:TonB family protein n=1 Tax=Helicobacter anatolicus TaxID=2905874 RepID=UPI001E4B98F3|nr:energy transducer TonB [Helicobacter anatolicus]MCE3036472.1 energy transducer TonB [Helicobacter anatolicus]